MASNLAAALLGGEGGANPAASYLDPNIANALPDIQLGQSLTQGSLSTAPASPWQALARVAQAGAGSYLQRGAISDLSKAYAHTADHLAQIFPAGTPIGDGLRSQDPTVRMMMIQQAGKAALVGQEGYSLNPGQERRIGPVPIATSGQPQSPEGKQFNDAAALARGGNPAAANAITSKISKEGQIGETGVAAPPVPLNGPRFQIGPANAAPAKPVPTSVPAINMQPEVPQPTADQMSSAKQKLGQKLQTVADSGITNPSATGVTSMSDQLAAAKANQKGAESTAEGNAKYYDSLHKGLAGSAMIGAQQKQNIDLLRQISESPNFSPGAGSETALNLQRIAARMGIKTEGAAPREIFNQVSARILADQMSGIKSMASETGETGGRIFKPMLDLEEKANITADDTPAGIKAKLNLLDHAGDLMMKWGDMADDYVKGHGKLDAGFDKTLRGEIAQARIPNIVPAAGGAQPAFPGGAAPVAQTAPRVADKAAYDALPKGTTYTAPDGSIRHKQ